MIVLIMTIIQEWDVVQVLLLESCHGFNPYFVRIVELVLLTLIVVLTLIVILTSTVLHLLYNEQKGLWNSWSMHRIRGCQEISVFGSLKTYDLTVI